MAPVAIIFGSISGTISALFGWMLFGLGLWGALQLYFLVALAVAALLIGYAMLRPQPAETPEKPDWQRA